MGVRGHFPYFGYIGGYLTLGLDLDLGTMPLILV